MQEVQTDRQTDIVLVNMKSNLRYIYNIQSVPRSKHAPSQLHKPVS